MNWPMVTLSEVLTIDRNSVTPENIVEGTKYVGLENINSDGEFQDVQIVENGELKSNKFKFDSQHILYGKLRPYLRKITRPDFSGICSTDILPIRCGPEMDRNFVYHYLRKQEMVNMATSQCSGANLPRLSPKRLLKFKIPKPPLGEQNRIAAILDKADEVKDDVKNASQLRVKILQNVFYDFFGTPDQILNKWKNTTLPEVIFFQEGPGVRKWQFQDSGIKLINIKNIVEGKLVLENTNRHLGIEEVRQKYNHFLTDEGDLLMASSGVTWGKTAWVEKKHLPLCLNTSIIRFKPKSKEVNKLYMYAFLNSECFKRQIQKLITGSAQPNFGPSHLEKIIIPMPPPNLQEKYARIHESIEKIPSSKNLVNLNSDSLVNDLLS